MRGNILMQGSGYGKSFYGSGWNFGLPHSSPTNNTQTYESHQFQPQNQQQAHIQQDVYSVHSGYNANFTADAFYNPTASEPAEPPDTYLSNSSQNALTQHSYNQSSQSHNFEESSWTNMFDPSMNGPGHTERSTFSEVQCRSSNGVSDTGSNCSTSQFAPNHSPLLPPNDSHKGMILTTQTWSQVSPYQSANATIVCIPAALAIKTNSALHPNPAFPYVQPPFHISKDFHLVARAVWKHLRDVCDQVRFSVAIH